MASASPMSSPRLPSPPPMAEDQTGPQSPLPLDSDDQVRLGGLMDLDEAASRRIRPGTKAADMHEGPPLTELGDIDSAFALTEHLKALHLHYTHNVATDTIVPLSRADAALLSKPPQGLEHALWLYELCRFLVQKVNTIIVGLFSDSPSCSAQTCPEMRASEWQYLCAVHDPPKSCCAIDYCCHTLDWAATTLTSPKHFPSRLTLGGGEGTGQPGQQMQVRHLTNIFRRVYRIFAHAWFQHREMFWRVEGKTGLYVFFKTVCDTYNLIPEDNYTIPPEAEGVDTDDAPVESMVSPGAILKRGATNGEFDERSISLGSPSAIHVGATARRQRHGHTRASSVVTTVVEENEDGEEDDGGEEEEEEEEEEEGDDDYEEDDGSHITEVHPTTSSESMIREGKYQGHGDASTSEAEGAETEAFPDVDESHEEVDESSLAASYGDSEDSTSTGEDKNEAPIGSDDMESFPDVESAAADASAASTSVGD